MILPPGIYESLIDEILKGQLEDAEREGLKAELEQLDDADAPSMLTQHIRRRVQEALSACKHSAHERLALSNAVLQALRAALPNEPTVAPRILDPPHVLLSIYAPANSAVRPGDDKAPPRPQSPMGTSSLLTGAPHEPQLDAELRQEFESADRVDVLCSFIKWSGLRILRPSIERFLSRQGTQLRVLTTSYLGATDYEAIECLAEMPRTQVKLSLDTRRTRMHAKAYLFHRNSGYTTAYIGSSNMSEPAMTSGLEWNIKVGQTESPHILEKFSVTFETYWHDAEFEAFTPESATMLRQALCSERATETDDSPFLFHITPFPFQQEILDRLEAEREILGRNRSLVVAATGTGKTVVAAFDYQRFVKSRPNGRTRLLFVAHREEILRQSLNCFRGVLRDPNFGDLLVGTARPASLESLFCSIQSWNSRGFSALTPADYYDYIVVDEFHRAAAPSYRTLFDHYRPSVLLGLTATPERSDGSSVAELFFDGHISAEIRLHEAIRRKLLCPFQYFGATDPVDHSRVTWRRGRYDVTELERLYTADSHRATVVVNELRDKVRDTSKGVGIGFCVSVRHAEYMAEFFRRCGIPADYLTGESADDERRDVKRRLTAREINFVFVVDLYNEGVDIPCVNTVLFLRPTESLTLFLQQLGRGLRLAEGKDCLTVLDFVGHAHRQFNFEQRFRALLGPTHRRVDQELIDGFPHVPPGCSIHLQKVAAQHVLENIRSQLGSRRAALVARIRGFAADTGKELTLANFLDHYELDGEAIYSRGTWSSLCVAAGQRPDYAGEDEAWFSRGLLRLSRADSAAYLQFVLNVLDERVEDDVAAINERLMATMLYYAFFTRASRSPKIDSLSDFFEKLRAAPTLCGELRELVTWRLSRIDHIEQELNVPYICPLRVHSSYHLDEILAAFGSQIAGRPSSFREGVHYVKNLKTDLLFVTLNKSQKRYSPTTMYKDYAISDRLFHWETQSTTSDTSPTGRRYIAHEATGHHILLFVRAEPSTAQGHGAPYTLVGKVVHTSHSGSRPMAVTWQLETPLPASLLKECRKLAAG